MEALLCVVVGARGCQRSGGHDGGLRCKRLWGLDYQGSGLGWGHGGRGFAQEHHSKGKKGSRMHLGREFLDLSVQVLDLGLQKGGMQGVAARCGTQSVTSLGQGEGGRLRACVWKLLACRGVSV